MRTKANKELNGLTEKYERRQKGEKIEGRVNEFTDKFKKRVKTVSYTNNPKQKAKKEKCSTYLVSGVFTHGFFNRKGDVRGIITVEGSIGDGFVEEAEMDLTEHLKEHYSYVKHVIIKNVIKLY